MRIAPSLRRLRLLNLAALSLLASILAHALLPSGTLFERHSGSAFSASTWDVSLGPSREGDRSAVQRAARNPDPVVGGDSGASITAHAAPLLSPQRAPDPVVRDSRGPPHAMRSGALPPPARGPPPVI